MSRKKRYTDEEFAEIMNTTGTLSDIYGDKSGSESDNSEIDKLEVDLLYDSDEDKEYVPKPGEGGDKSSDEENWSKGKKKRRERLSSTPAKRQATHPDFSTPINLC